MFKIVSLKISINIVCHFTSQVFLSCYEDLYFYLFSTGKQVINTDIEYHFLHCNRYTISAPLEFGRDLFSQMNFYLK